MRLKTLGAVRFDGPEAERLRGRRKELALLAYLARRAPRSASRDDLATLCWGNRPDANARQSLRQALSHLKQAAGEGLILDGEQVSLAPDAVSLDAIDFEQALDDRRPATALDLYRGDFLQGLEDAGDETFRVWVESEREALRTRAAAAFDRVIDEHAERGEAEEALRWARRWAELFPLEERPATALHAALARLGRVEEARGCLAGFVARSRRESGVEPSPAILALLEDSEHPPRAVASPPSPGVRALFTPELAGRTPELAALRAAWEAAVAGSGTLVLVEGAEGLGKTRLCEEFLRGLPEVTSIYRARGLEPRHSVAWGLARELLADLPAAAGVAAAPPAALARAGTVLPGLMQRFPGAGREATHQDVEAAIGEVVAAVASEAPVLLFVDDVQWADRESTDLILSLARRHRRSALCIVLTATPGEVPRALRDELRGRPGAVHIHLAPLAASDAKAFISSMLVMAPEDLTTLAVRLHAETAGHPLAIAETVAWLVDEGYVTADARGLWRLAETLPPHLVPAHRGLASAVRQRFARLSDQGRRFAAALAVLGTPASRETLEQLSELAPEEMHAALEELLLSRVIRSAPGSDERFEFGHEVARRIVYHQLGVRERRRLHVAVVGALKAARGQPAARDILAYHRRQAGHLARFRHSALGWATLAAVVLAGSLGVWILQGRGVGGFAERDWIVLTGLHNATGDTLFDESLAAAFYLSLSQSRHVNVFPPQRVRETLQRMRRDTVRRLTEQLAREVAQREGIQAVVALDLTGSDPGYTLAARIVQPETGRTLSTLSVTADGRTTLLPALDRLATDLRRALGESGTEIRQGNLPLPQATTSSLEALKLFAEGSRALDEGRMEDGYKALQAAIALDSNFAWAHAELGRYLAWGNQPLQAAPHLARALALTDRLPERERLQVRRIVAQGRRDRVEAIRLARQYLAQYPDDRDAWFALGRTLQEAGDRDGAIEAYRRELEIDPRATSALVNSAVIHHLAGHPHEAVRAFERAAALDSTLRTTIAGDLNRIYGFSLLSTGDSARARAVFERLLTGGRSQQINGLRSLALLDAYYGRYARATSRLMQAIRLGMGPSGGGVTELRNRLYLAGMLRTRGAQDAARRQVQIADSMQRTWGTPLPWLGFLGRHAARLGLVHEGTQVLETMLQHDTASASDEDRAAVALVRGELSLARGDYAAAVAALTRAVELNGTNYTRQGLARALVAVGRPQDAVATYQAMLRDSALGWEAQEPWVLAHYELARLYDQQGDSATALPLYRRLADLWRHGDDDLPPLRETRRRLEQEGR
jgi:DNA-binding SARP family transcriptional activator